MSESLRDQLAANYDKIVENAPIAPEQPGVSEIADIPDTAATPSGASGEAPVSKITEAKPESKERARDPETGKFVEKSAAAPAKTPDGPSSSIESQAQVAGPSTVKPKPARPSSWKKDYWNHWDKLTAGETLSPEEALALADYMNQRETDFQHGVSTYKREWESAKPLLDAMAPFRPILEQHKIDPGTWISNLGNAHRLLALGSPQQKLQMFGKLCQDYGIPPAALIDQAAQQQYLGSGGNGPVSSVAGPPPLTREEAITLWESQFAQHANMQEIERFGAQHDKYPHFEALRETMAQLLEAGLAEDLISAYEAALRHPRHSDIWQAVQEQERAKDTETRARAEAERLSKAKGKAVSVRSSTPSAPTEDKPKGLRSQLESSFDEVIGGGRV